MVSPEQKQGRGRRYQLAGQLGSHQQIAFQNFTGRIAVGSRAFKDITFEGAQECPKICFIDISDSGAQRRQVFEIQRSGFIQQRPNFFRGCLALF